MNSRLKWILLGLTVLVAIVMIASYPVVASAQGPTPVPPALSTNPWGYGWGPSGMTLAPHASVGVGGWWGGYAPTQGYTSTVPYGYRGWGPGGMMGGWGGYGYGYAPCQLSPAVCRVFSPTLCRGWRIALRLRLENELGSVGH